MKRTVTEDEKPNKTTRLWKITGQVILYGFIVIAGYFFVKQEVANFDFQSWWNPFYVSETPKVAAKPEKPTVKSLLEAVNKVRADAGVAPLAIDERLNESAQVKADDMLTRNYFDHADPDGKHGYSIAVEYAPNCERWSENILRFTSDELNTTETVMSGWIGSKDHYEAMIASNVNVTGFGIAGKNIVEHFCQLK